MAIGISYTNASGQTYGMSATSAQSALSSLQSIMSQSEQSALSSLRKRRQEMMQSAGSSRGMTNEEYHRLKERRRAEREAKKAAREAGEKFDPNANGGFFGKAKALAGRIAEIAKGLIGFNSSIEEVNGKLRLVGDGRVVNTGDVYGKDIRGLKGFWPLKEMIEGVDRREIGKQLGNSDSSDADVQTDERNADANTPFTETYVTRIVAEQTKDEDIESETYGQAITMLYAFVRDRMNTGLGRVFHIGKERMLQICRLDTIPGLKAKEYIAGDDTNIVFTEVEDPSDPDYGKIKVDVYYV